MMRPRDFAREFLRVEWYDGLVVSSEHLAHSDRNAAVQAADVAASLGAHPGIFQVESRAGEVGQLFRIVDQGMKDGQFVIRLELRRYFRALTASGGVVIGIPNQIPRAGYPTPDLAVIVPPSAENVFIAVRQQFEPGLTASELVADGELRLRYPTIGFEAVTMEQYRSSRTTTLSDCTFVASLSRGGDKYTVRDSYVPPLATLEACESFGNAAVRTLAGLYSSLLDMCTRLVQTGEANMNKEEIGRAFLARHFDHQVLRMILLGQVGVIRDLGSFSPSAVLSGSLLPLATWFDAYVARFGGPDTDRSRALAAEVQSLTVEDLGVATDGFLSTAERLLRRVSDPGVLH